MSQFKKIIYGKWVLSGEYNVLNKGSALVYPLPNYYIQFLYKNLNTSFKIQRSSGLKNDELHNTILQIIHKALIYIKKKPTDLTGLFTIQDHIPFRSGLGASSVICLGIASLFLYKKYILQKDLKKMAVYLEHFFHKQSSGMDITAILKNKAILYNQNHDIQYLPKCAHKPRLFLSYSGSTSSTSIGVKQVSLLFKTQSQQAHRISNNMTQSVNLCLQALKTKEASHCFKLLQQAISLGEKCFKDWNLISPDLQKHLDHLKYHGAAATKPTGSGLHGHVISLWDQDPPKILKKDLLQLHI